MRVFHIKTWPTKEIEMPYYKKDPSMETFLVRPSFHPLCPPSSSRGYHGADYWTLGPFHRYRLGDFLRDAALSCVANNGSHWTEMYRLW